MLIHLNELLDLANVKETWVSELSGEIMEMIIKLQHGMLQNEA